MIFYTWKDIDRYCKENRLIWENTFSEIEVYPDEMIVRKRNKTHNVTKDVLRKLFPQNYVDSCFGISLDGFNKVIKVYEEDSEEDGDIPIKVPDVRPLFEDVPYFNNVYPVKNLDSLKKPLIAFHSYKGGVGRTLSLIAFAKAWSEALINDGKASRLLIIDADVEAPGLTWLRENEDSDHISYLDILEIIQDTQKEHDVNEIVNNICSLVSNSRISIETETQRIDHYFVPAYRYETQLLDIYATPKSIANQRDKKYILAEFISRMCERLECDVALIDLRAGISSYSAPILFDPRVKKYLVSSTSSQSIRGTRFVLTQLMKGIKITEDSLIPEVFVNMMPADIMSAERQSIICQLEEVYELPITKDFDSLTDNTIHELPFASELIHDTTLEQISRILSDRDIYKRIKKLVIDSYGNDEYSNVNENREEKLGKINRMAQSQLTAENGEGMDALLTEPLKNLVRKFRNIVPRTVVLGTKGSGKTFLFRKMVLAKEWTAFCKNLDKESISPDNIYFLPLIVPKNTPRMLQELLECIQHLNNQITFANVDDGVFLETSKIIDDRLERKESIDYAVWDQILARAVSSDYASLRDINAELRKEGKKIVFLIDGLEELFKKIESSEIEQTAVRTLCQDIISNLSVKYSNIGIVLFLRRDLAKAAISINYEQFERSYVDVMLNWSNQEALRLAIWLVEKAIPGFYNGTSGIEVASINVVNKQLEKLWGKKLGRPNSNEAYSSNWILAALSDFNGQLQARDMIRFLSEAAIPGKKGEPYTDRLLMPTEIRSAIQRCSLAKLKGVKEEYSSLAMAFKKIEDLPDNKRNLPLDPTDVKLDSTQEKNMVDEGFLRRVEEKYYVPESIRSALNLKYGRGARPKVLALMRNR